MMIVVVPKGGEQETVDEGSNQCLVSEALVAVPGMGSIARRTAWPEQRARVLFCGALSRHRPPVRAEEGSVGREDWELIMPRYGCKSSLIVLAAPQVLRA